MDAGTGSSSESSQNIVDELFKDFISKKISKNKSTVASKETPKPAKVDEISKLLDLEISSIQAQTKEPSDKEKDVKANQNNSTSVFVSQALPFELKNDTNSVQNVTASIPLPPLPPQGPVNCISSSKAGIGSNTGLKTHVSAVFSSGTIVHTVESLSSVAKPIVPLIKKLNIPKQLGCKLSTQSLSLIKSNEKIDRNGRTWEEGEVQSSNSEDSNKDSDSDDNEGYPSETGSIHSDKEDWKSAHSSSSKHKKKHHKHKHKKKKKKKSSKEKDKPSNQSEDEKGSKKSKEKDKRSRKDKGESSSASTSSHKDKSSGDKDRKSSERNKENGDEKSRGKGSDSESSKADRKTADKDKTDDRRREKEKKRKHERSRSRTPKRSKRSRSRSRSPRKSRRSPSPRRSRYSEWDARRYGDDSKHRSRSRSRSPARSKRRRSPDKKRDRTPDRNRDRSGDRKQDKSKERDKDRDLRLQIDKAKLRKIAIANALNSMKAGQTVPVQLDVAAVKSGGKSVEELTDFCKRISEKEQEHGDNAISDSSEEETGHHSEDEEPLIHHPFKVKDTSANIVMNIRNAKQLPVLTPSEKQVQQASLRLAFPVSSGTHHRASESEWVPVEKTTAQPTPTTTTTTKVVDSKITMIESQPEVKDSIFPTTAAKVDIGAIISERLQAVRKLQANPYDVQALSSMHKAQEKASQWAQSKHLPGQFVGSTGAQVMSQQELMGDKRRQAWVKKSQFSTATPVSGGIGMFLLQKMGWKQGEGLGKNNEGNTQPLQLDIKIDRKGLQSAADNPKSKPQIAHVPQAKDLSHKHPVSALMELCNKRRWGPPNFTVVQEDGPAHKKCFLFKVKVNNVEYQPAVPSSNKKSAKAQCAAVCLQEMGLLPRDAHVNY